MSDYAYVAERARKIFASVSRLEADLQHNPENWAVQRNLKSMKKLASQARFEMEELAEKNKIEICDYRIMPDEGWRYALEHVANSFLQYQLLFSQVYDALRNGPKERARIGSEAAQESTLEFGYSYAGSLGAVLLCQSNRDFFEGNLDKPIDALNQVLEVGDSDDVKDIAHTLGRAVIKRVHDWSKVNVKGRFSADVQWKKSDGIVVGQMVSLQRMQRIVDVIGRASDEKTKHIDVKGLLVAVSLPRRSFQISVPNSETYAGYFDYDASLPTEFSVGRMYDARIKISESYLYAEDRHVIKYSLIHINGPIEY